MNIRVRKEVDGSEVSRKSLRQIFISDVLDSFETALRQLERCTAFEASFKK
ncbi:TPA: hypothetical protein HA351_08575 [Methanosarcinaceae archaeon]|nr:hypothetical protein [Methanosarcinaceae archaeon]